MNCASCGRSTSDGQVTNWVTGRKSESTNRESATSTIFITRGFYHDFAPLTVFLCNACYAREEKRQKTLFWLFVALTGLSAAGLLYALVGPPDSVLRIIFGVPGLPLLVVGIGGAAHFSFVKRLKGRELRSHLTETFVRRIVRTSGRDVFWTEEDFEANQHALLQS